MKKKSVILPIIQTILSSLLCIPAIIVCFPMKGMIIDGYDFSLFFFGPVLILVVGYYIISNFVSWMLFFKKSKDFLVIIVFIVINMLFIFRIGLPFALNSINFFSQPTAKDFEYKDNTPNDIPLIELLYYNPSITVEENIKDIAMIFNQNQNTFADKVYISENYDDLYELDFFRDNSFKDIVVYNDYRKEINSGEMSRAIRTIEGKFYTNENKIVSRFGYVTGPLEEYPDIVLEPNKKYLDIIYENWIDEHQISFIDTNFIANDVENIFGGLINRNDFESVLEGLKKGFDSREDMIFYFETENDAQVIVDCSSLGLSIYGAVLMEINEYDNGSNLDNVKLSQVNFNN